jgi:hypothetical protein
MASRVLMVLLAGWLLLPAQPLWAQSFGYSPAPRPYTGYGRSYGYQGYGYRPPYYQRERDFDEDDPPPVQRSFGTVRTLCVRLCDGYYFPISFATSRSALARDADSCTASCGSEARLFYYSNPGGDIETMVDLNGLAYQSLPNAFKYRKTLVNDCRCRPQPWSETELQRHRAYAAGQPAPDIRADARVRAAAPVLPSATPTVLPGAPLPDDAMVVARPLPVDRQVERVLPPPPPRAPRPSTTTWGSSKPNFVWPGDSR